MANVFWFGGSGNWSDAAHWSNNSGNIPASLHGSAPSANESVVFDTLSNTAAYTVTVDVAATCLNFTMGAPLSGKVTWAGTSALAISGNLTLTGGTAGITRSYSGTITFNATSGTKTITSNGVVWTGNVLINGSGGTFVLGDSFIISAGTFKVTAGTLDATTNSTTLTFTSGGTTSLEGPSGITLYNLTLAPTTPAKTGNIALTGNVTITHTLTVTMGATATNRLLIKSDTIGTPRTITITGTTGNSFSNVDFDDISIVNIVSGNQVDLDLSDTTKCPGGSGDCGGNSGITFIAGANQFWYKASGSANNWSTVGNWYLGTGGSSGAGRVPLPQDTAIFDNLSFGAGSMVVTQDMPRIPTTTFAGVDGVHPVTNTPEFTTSTVASVIGSLTLVSGMLLTASTQLYNFEGRGNHTLTSAGKTWAKIIQLNNATGLLTLLDDFISSSSLHHIAARFDANDHNITVTKFVQSNSGDLTLWMGNGTWEITTAISSMIGSWCPQNNIVGYAFNLYAEGSTIKFTDTTNTALNFGGNNTGRTYNNIWFARGASTASNYIGGINVFNDFKDTGTEAHGYILPNGSTQTVNTFTVSGTTGKLVSLRNSTGTSKATLAKAGGGTIRSYYMDVDYITGSPDNTWYMYRSTDGGHNTRIYFIYNQVKKMLGVAKASIKKVEGVGIDLANKIIGVQN